MLLLGLKNTTSQTVLTNGVIDLGSVYRKYCKKCNGITTFATNSNSVRLNQPGMYHITATLVGSGTTAGDLIVQLNENGFAIPSALSSQTITTATTEQSTFVIDYFIIVNSSCVLGNLTTEAKTLTLTNTGVGATFTSVVFNVEKVL